jgi:hypothetical protein
MADQRNVFVIGNLKYDLFDNFKGLSPNNIYIVLLKKLFSKEIQLTPEHLEFFGKKLMHNPSNFNILSMIPYAEIVDDEFAKGSLKSYFENNEIDLIIDEEGSVLPKLEKTQMFKTKKMFEDKILETNKLLEMNQEDFQFNLHDSS